MSHCILHIERGTPSIAQITLHAYGVVYIKCYHLKGTFNLHDFSFSYTYIGIQGIQGTLCACPTAHYTVHAAHLTLHT